VRIKTADNQPDPEGNEGQRPCVLNDVTAEEIQLIEQEKQAQSDENEGADGLLAPPVHRRRNGRSGGIDKAGCGRRGRRVWSLPGALIRLLVLARGIRRRLIARGCWISARVCWARINEAGVGGTGIRRATPRLVLAGGLVRAGLAGCTRTLAEIEPITHLIEAQGIRWGLAVAERPGGMEGLKRLVEDPGGNKEAEDSVVFRDADQHGKYHDVDQALEELSVVHGADAGDEAENGSRRGVRTLRVCGDERLLQSLPGSPAGLAENLPASRGTYAVGAERLSAVLAKGGCGNTAVIYAVHIVLLSRRAIAEPPECADRDPDVRDGHVR